MSLVDYGRARYHLKEYEEAIDVLQQVCAQRPVWLTARTLLLAAYWRSERCDLAREQADWIRQHHPGFSLERWAEMFPYRRAEDLADIIDPLKETGL